MSMPPSPPGPAGHDRFSVFLLDDNPNNRDPNAMREILSLEHVLDEAARRGGEAGATAGARAVLHELGLDDPGAARDLRELRDLLRSWRDAKRVAWRTIVRWVTTIMLAAIAAGAAFWATGRYGTAP